MHDSKGKAILGGYPVRVKTERIGRIFFDSEGVMILYQDGSIEFKDAEFCSKHVEMIYSATPFPPKTA